MSRTKAKKEEKKKAATLRKKGGALASKIGDVASQSQEKLGIATDKAYQTLATNAFGLIKTMDGFKRKSGLKTFRAPFFSNAIEVKPHNELVDDSKIKRCKVYNAPELPKDRLIINVANIEFETDHDRKELYKKQTVLNCYMKRDNTEQIIPLMRTGGKIKGSFALPFSVADDGGFITIGICRENYYNAEAATTGGASADGGSIDSLDRQGLAPVDNENKPANIIDQKKKARSKFTTLKRGKSIKKSNTEQLLYTVTLHISDLELGKKQTTRLKLNPPGYLNAKNDKYKIKHEGLYLNIEHDGPYYEVPLRDIKQGMLCCKFGNKWNYAWVSYTNKGITIYKDEKENKVLKSITENDVIFGQATPEQCSRNNAFIAKVPLSAVTNSQQATSEESGDDVQDFDICKDDETFMYLTFTEDSEELMKEWTTASEC